MSEPNRPKPKPRPRQSRQSPSDASSTGLPAKPTIPTPAPRKFPPSQTHTNVPTPEADPNEEKTTKQNPKKKKSPRVATEEESDTPVTDETLPAPSPHQIKLFLNIICKNDGKITVGDLRELAAQNSSLKQYAKFTELEDLLQELPICRLGPEACEGRTVKACTDLEVCESYAKEKKCLLGDLCQKLHICKQFAMGQKCNPTAGEKCAFGHVLGTEHNSPLLKKHFLDILAKTYVVKLIQQNYAHHNFRACAMHSTKNSCRKKDACKRMHVCKYFLQNRCRTTTTCRRSHDLTGSQPQQLLASHGFDPSADNDWILQEMKDSYAFGKSQEGGDSDSMSQVSHTSSLSSQKQRRNSKSEEARATVPQRPVATPSGATATEMFVRSPIPYQTPPLYGGAGYPPPMNMGYPGLMNLPPNPMYPPPGPGAPPHRHPNQRMHIPPLMGYPGQPPPRLPAAGAVRPPLLTTPSEVAGVNKSAKKSRNQKRRDKKHGEKEGGKDDRKLAGQAHVLNSILFEVCQAGGVVQLPVLMKTIQKKHPRLKGQVQSVSKLKRILKKWPSVFRCEKNEESETVEAFTVLTLCTKFSSRNGCREEDCKKLHLCRNFLTNTCNFGKPDKPCRFGHQIRSPHNLKLLDENNLARAPAKHVKLLVAKSSCEKSVPEVCRFYNSYKGCKYTTESQNCTRMHICRYFIRGTCRTGKKCSKNHTIREPQCLRVLMRSRINVKRPDSQVLQELREMMKDDTESELGDQDQGDLSEGSEDLMDFSSSESGDEMLIYFSDTSDEDDEKGSESLGKFKGGSKTDLLKCQKMSFGLDTAMTTDDDVALVMRPSEGPKRGKKGSKPSESDLPQHSLMDEDDNSFPEICLFNLRAQCSYKDSCKNKHASTAFQWQERVHGVWKDMSVSDNRDIEINFCDPSKMECFIGDAFLSPTMIHFAKMTATQAGNPEERQVRRLSTPSSAGKPAHYTYTTTWNWYWRDDHGVWIEYGGEDAVTGSWTDTTPGELEERYLQDPFGGTLFQAGEATYFLDFKSMVQKNTESGNMRVVRRRPNFVTHAPAKTTDVMSSMMEMMKQITDKMEKLEARGSTSEASAESANSSELTFPKHWSRSAPMEAGGYQVVEIPSTGKKSKEYQQVALLFNDSLSKKTIRSIKRIQNMELWDNFQRKKAAMEKKLPKGGTLLERHLFHGTHNVYTDAICQQGFDWRVSGLSVGTRHGKGSYFARDARFSNCYTDCGKLFLVRVLVGEYAKGGPDIVRPPPKDPKRPYVDLYDSCVDKMDDPSIFVIFSQDQAYPEWLIEY